MDIKSISIDDLDILVSFYDDFEGFNEGLASLSQKYGNDDVRKKLEMLAAFEQSNIPVTKVTNRNGSELVDAVIMGKKVFVMPDDIKEFYKNYYGLFQAIIEKTKSSDYYVKGQPLVSNFLFTKYDEENGLMINPSSFAFFYHYLQEHEEEIPRIFLVVDKLKKLGISEVTLDESADFTDEVYSTFDASNITLLDNMKILPTYYQGEACYHSLDSKYKITRPLDEKNWPYNDSREITLTSLAIDSKTLPDSLEDAAINELFSGMRSESWDLNGEVFRSVELFSVVKDYQDAFSDLESDLEYFESCDFYPKVGKALSLGRQTLSTLKAVRRSFDKKLVASSPGLSKKKLRALQKEYRGEVKSRRMDLD